MVSRYAHDGCTDLLHRRVMTGGQRICDPIPYANKGARTIGFRTAQPPFARPLAA
jgi:hypothetical protein